MSCRASEGVLNPAGKVEIQCHKSGCETRGPEGGISRQQEINGGGDADPNNCDVELSTIDSEVAHKQHGANHTTPD